ncbi:twitching motility protein PilT [Chloroflexus islandicus]|uniref:Twitching motility protein PilT n=1 Tax=Chloroflexus islandicus TaxID=1707952 RepID=A0A178M984_9CHLR|nr:type II toxin-antitoxin system VapC family toxin [Chloroflexus islandicus]OAN45093.1 twitching motility protein PilT [Chloroflexus islandicus]
MNLLLDTHSFIWFIDDHPALSSHARDLIAEPTHTIFLSIASIWEMAIKVSLGKLELNQPFELFLPYHLIRNNINILDIAIDHAMRVATLPFHHRDPFDRLIIAQSLIENIPIIGSDAVFDAYGVSRLW